jgi:hypothetical protein
VLGVGGEPEYYGIPGIKEHAFTIWSFEDALRIRRHIEDVFRRAAEEKDPVKRSELLTFVIAGAGFTGIELAGELMDQRRVLCRARHIDEKDVRIIVVEALDAIIPNLPQKLQQKADATWRSAGADHAALSDHQHRSGVLLAEQSIAPRTFVWTVESGCEFANLALKKENAATVCAVRRRRNGGVKNCTFSRTAYSEGKVLRQRIHTVRRLPERLHRRGRRVAPGKQRVNPQIVDSAVRPRRQRRTTSSRISQRTNEDLSLRYHGIGFLGAFSRGPCHGHLLSAFLPSA